MLYIFTETVALQRIPYKSFLFPMVLFSFLDVNDWTSDRLRC
jgi:hypothetical protein